MKSSSPEKVCVLQVVVVQNIAPSQFQASLFFLQVATLEGVPQEASVATQSTGQNMATSAFTQTLGTRKSWKCLQKRTE